MVSMASASGRKREAPKADGPLEPAEPAEPAKPEPASLPAEEAPEAPVPAVLPAAEAGGLNCLAFGDPTWLENLPFLWVDFPGFFKTSIV